MLNKTNEQFAQTTTKNVDTAHEFIQASLDSIEKLTKLQLNASKKFLDETSEAIKAITQTNNPKDLFEKVNQLASSSVENNISNCRDVYEIMTEVQSKIGKMVETQIQATQKSMVNAVDGLSKFNPSATKSNGVASDSIKNWLNTTNQAMSAMSKVAAQVTEFTNNNIQAATKATENAVKKATGKK